MVGVPMYERILRRSWGLPPEAIEVNDPLALTGAIIEVEQVIGSAVPFDIQGVSDYFYAHDQERWNWQQDFPNYAPPFPTFWMETGAPPYVFSREMGKNAFDVQLVRWGALFDWTEGSADGDCLRARLFVSLRMFDLVPMGPVVEVLFDVAPDGRLRSTPTVLTLMSVEGERAEAIGANSFFLFPFALALSFLHCRNVKQIENLPPRQQRRLSERRGEPVVTFRTLAIEPMKQVLDHEGRARQDGLKKALHICRGHFAHYSADKPLFGKYAGQYWRPAHVRGSADAGMVGKDYHVKAPAQSSPK